MAPETFLRVLGPKPYRVAYVQPSRRPADGRYGENPNRLYKHQQLQVILKPSPADVIEQYLGSLEAIGIDLRKHDIKFEEDNWEAPTLGAWGIGWQVMLDGLEITQFTYFQQCGGIDLDLVPAEITYGLERIVAFLQNVDSVYDIEWAPGFKYADVRLAEEQQFSVYNFEMADVPSLWQQFELHEGECQRLLGPIRGKQRKNQIPAVARLRAGAEVLACFQFARCARRHQRHRARWRDRARPQTRGRRRRSLEIQQNPVEDGGRLMPDFLLEIGTEEIPDWMIEDALQNLRINYQASQAGHLRGTIDLLEGTPRRLALRLRDIDFRMDDREEVAAGPYVSAGEKAAQGFARKHNTTLEALRREPDAKGERYFAAVLHKGEPASAILSAVLPEIISRINWPKTMYWTGRTGVRFIRPIRWIVALLDGDVIPFEIAGISSANTTRGHRILSATQPIPVTHRGLRTNSA